jgi:SAM-dependent methyltransferase
VFTRSFRFYDALYNFKDYDAAADQLHDLVQAHGSCAKSLLDVGCGTGKHLERFQCWYQVEGVDLDPHMIALARARLPGVPLHEADMQNFDLGRSFDVVTCLFSSIAYVRTVQGLERAIRSMARHLHPGGMLIVEPWVEPEQYRLGQVTANFTNEPDLKIAWMYTSDIDGHVSVFDINYLVGTPAGIEHFIERHEMGLFTAAQYREAFEAAGMDVVHHENGPFGRGLYVATRPGVLVSRHGGA